VKGSGRGHQHQCQRTRLHTIQGVRCQPSSQEGVSVAGWDRALQLGWLDIHNRVLHHTAFPPRERRVGLIPATLQVHKAVNSMLTLQLGAIHLWSQHATAKPCSSWRARSRICSLGNYTAVQSRHTYMSGLTSPQLTTHVHPCRPTGGWPPSGGPGTLLSRT
jgi:hypothetical protein